MLYQRSLSIKNAVLAGTTVLLLLSLPIHVYARSCHDLHPVFFRAIMLGNLKSLEKRIKYLGCTCTFQKFSSLKTKKWKLLLIIWNDLSNYKSLGDENKVQNAFTVSQILMSVKEITPVTWMLSAITPLDHMYVNVSLDILEMDKTAQVNLIS